MAKNKTKLLIIFIIFLLLGLIFIYHRSIRGTETIKPGIGEETIQESEGPREK